MNQTFEPVFDQIIVQSDDTAVKQLCVENAFTFPPVPSVGNDVAATVIKDRKSNHQWLVFRFYHKSDEGYLAFGLPLETPAQLVKFAWRFILECQPSKGGYTFTELDELLAN